MSKRKAPAPQRRQNKIWVAQWWEAGRKKSKVLVRCTDLARAKGIALQAGIPLRALFY
jgi:hypothetical protein